MKKNPSEKSKLFTRVSTIAACGALITGLSVGAYAYMAPASYVSMDVNPSIEYTLNMFDRVLSVQAVNEDGAHILQAVNLSDLSHQSIDEAVKLTLGEITAKGYFDGNVPGGIVIATSGKEPVNAEKLADHLKEIVTAQCAENNHTVSVETMTVDQAQLDEAKTLGVTPGKLLLVQELQSENPANVDFIPEEWLNKSVKDIMAEIERVDALEDAADALEDAKEDAADALEDAKEDAADALEDAEEAAEDAKDDAEEAAEDARDAAKEALEDAKEAAEDAKDDAEEAAEDARDAAKKALEDAKEAAEDAEEAAKDAADEKRDLLNKKKDLAEEDEAKDADEAEEPETDDTK
ncbi:MAG: hypothetical protein RR320_00255 [Oscillospiraceae bacterium]